MSPPRPIRQDYGLPTYTVRNGHLFDCEAIMPNMEQNRITFFSRHHDFACPVFGSKLSIHTNMLQAGHLPRGYEMRVNDISVRLFMATSEQRQDGRVEFPADITMALSAIKTLSAVLASGLVFTTGPGAPAATLMESTTRMVGDRAFYTLPEPVDLVEMERFSVVFDLEKMHITHPFLMKVALLGEITIPTMDGWVGALRNEVTYGAESVVGGG